MRVTSTLNGKQGIRTGYHIMKMDGEDTRVEVVRFNGDENDTYINSDWLIGLDEESTGDHVI